MEFCKIFCQNYSRAPKGLSFFFSMASHRPWEGACKWVGQCSKATPKGPMRKGQNWCAIALGPKAQGEKLSFSPKTTRFFYPGKFIEAVRVPASDASPPPEGSNRFLGIYSKIRPKFFIFHGILKKKSTKTTSGLQKDSHFFSAIASLMGRPVNKAGSKFQGIPERPMRKGQNMCDIAFNLSTWGEKLGFYPKVTQFFSSRAFLEAARVPPSEHHRCEETLIVFWEFILKLGWEN